MPTDLDDDPTLVRPPERLPLRRRLPRIPLREGTRESARRFAGRLFLELLVVFVGVYAASTVAQRQQDRAAAERRTQLRAALAEEIRDITRRTRNAARGAGGAVAAYDSAWKTGQRPPLEPFLEPVRVQTHMWETAMASNGLDLLDVPTVYRLSRFYNRLNGGFEQLEQLRTLSETQILPTLDGGAEAFYDPATGRLLPRFIWYRAALQNLREDAEVVTALGDSLLVDLAPPSDSIRSDSARP